MQNPENHRYTPDSISFITRSIILTALLLASFIDIGHAEVIEEKKISCSSNSRHRTCNQLGKGTFIGAASRGPARAGIR